MPITGFNAEKSRRESVGKSVGCVLDWVEIIRKFGGNVLTCRCMVVGFKEAGGRRVSLVVACWTASHFFPCQNNQEEV